MLHRATPILLALVIVLNFGASVTGQAYDGIRLTIVYDNQPNDPRLTSNWGFSCSIEGLERTILFDAGAEPTVLCANLRVLSLDPLDIDPVHGHWDHYGGLLALTDVGVEAPRFAPMSLPINVRSSVWPSDRLLLRRTTREVCAGGAYHQTAP